MNIKTLYNIVIYSLLFFWKTIYIKNDVSCKSQIYKNATIKIYGTNISLRIFMNWTKYIIFLTVIDGLIHLFISFAKM